LYIRPAFVDFILRSYDNRQKMTEEELDSINHQLISILFRLGKVAKDNKDVLPIVAEIDARGDIADKKIRRGTCARSKW
jgi:hypothetical protein